MTNFNIFNLRIQTDFLKKDETNRENILKETLSLNQAINKYSRQCLLTALVRGKIHVYCEECGTDYFGCVMRRLPLK